ncbi:hypothetical protein CR513_44062, partial [Mucuna pruriens]
MLLHLNGEVYGWFLSRTVNCLALCKLVFSYDLNKETHRYLLMPIDLSQVLNDHDLEILKGCLCLSHDHKRTHFINIFKVPDIHPYRMVLVIFMCLSENDDVIFWQTIH